MGRGPERAWAPGGPGAGGGRGSASIIVTACGARAVTVSARDHSNRARSRIPAPDGRGLSPGRARGVRAPQSRHRGGGHCASRPHERPACTRGMGERAVCAHTCTLHPGHPHVCTRTRTTRPRVRTRAHTPGAPHARAVTHHPSARVRTCTHTGVQLCGVQASCAAPCT